MSHFPIFFGFFLFLFKLHQNKCFILFIYFVDSCYDLFDIDFFVVEFSWVSDKFIRKDLGDISEEFSIYLVILLRQENPPHNSPISSVKLWKSSPLNHPKSPKKNNDILKPQIIPLNIEYLTCKEQIKYCKKIILGVKSRTRKEALISSHGFSNRKVMQFNYRIFLLLSIYLLCFGSEISIEFFFFLSFVTKEKGLNCRRIFFRRRFRSKMGKFLGFLSGM